MSLSPNLVIILIVVVCASLNLYKRDTFVVVNKRDTFVVVNKRDTFVVVNKRDTFCCGE